MTDAGNVPVPSQHLGAGACRAEEFGRWSRVMLDHERRFLSKVMATRAGYLSSADKDAIMHDLSDIDQILAHMGLDELKHPDLVQTAYPDAGYEGLRQGEPQFEVWPISEGPVRPSQRKKK